MASQMDRRQFLKLGGFLTVSVATVGLAACGSTDYSDPGVPLASGSDWKFPQSVASGDPRADSAMLWTRVVPASFDAVGMAASVRRFRWRRSALQSRRWTGR